MWRVAIGKGVLMVKSIERIYMKLFTRGVSRAAEQSILRMIRIMIRIQDPDYDSDPTRIARICIKLLPEVHLV